MALLEKNALAMAAIGFLADEQCVDVLLYAPFQLLGGNANYEGLRLLCGEPKSREWVKARLNRTELTNSHRAMIVMALAQVHDPAALEPLGELIRALTRPADFNGDLRERPHDPHNPVLPTSIQAAEVLWLADHWGDPRLGDALAEHIYASSGDLQPAFAAAKACGVTLSKPRLLALAARQQPSGDADAVLAALTPMLEAKDGPEIASLLAPAYWTNQDFATRVLWIPKIPGKVLTTQLRSELIAVAEKHSNGAIREWASQALGRFTDPEAEESLQQAEGHGSQAALRILCERSSDPSAAFLSRFTNSNAAIRDAAFGLVERQFFEYGTAVPGGLDPERRAEILSHLLADWPGADSPPDRVQTAVTRLYVLVTDRGHGEAARWTPEAAAAVVRCAEQTIARNHKYNYYTMLPALRWAHTPDARKVVERFAQGNDPILREAAEETLKKW
jgi:hypothetical protein